ncbi:hypothetical protein CLV62_13711 [Dysgonomonas alginatilytica]|uniref:Uncharacterized protein n=1 Tax=Dysgonomonas alginatilytica TaxID=1605892 RepID=A0A2V3PIA9_9BACT|nr:hypothetical protein CLV62_13711 [Dysgonomonas alginatilytica]
MKTNQLFNSSEVVALDKIVGGKGIDMHLPKNYIEISYTFYF